MSDMIHLTGGAIDYRLRGSGPPLVLLSTLSGSWMRQVLELSRHHTVLTYDMRGFGDSPSNSDHPTNAEHADDLAAVLDALGMDTAVVVGMSHGGLVAQHFALKHGYRLAGLGLVATFCVPHGPTTSCCACSTASWNVTTYPVSGRFSRACCSPRPTRPRCCVARVL